MCALLKEGVGFPCMSLEGAPGERGDIILHVDGRWTFDVYHTSPRVAERYYVVGGRVECEYLGEWGG